MHRRYTHHEQECSPSWYMHVGVKLLALETVTVEIAVVRGDALRVTPGPFQVGSPRVSY